MSFTEIARFAKIKGLNVVGTGDFTHPKWLKEIQETLTQQEETGIYKLAGKPDSSVCFMLSTEVSTIFDFKGASKKIHNVILAPNVDVAIQVNDALKSFGDLAEDGRPMLKLSAAHLVEEVMQVSNKNLVFPAHAWTPWFSIFGAFSGFDSIEECYQDMTKHIHALETGLSSDPPMNWRLSMLDRFTLVSNSDSHSFWPWRIGREANVFDLTQISYGEIVDAICSKDPERFKFTIETDPAYGKYHWTGHRNCNVSLSPKEAQKFNNICPVCHRRLTKGVEQRVEELADRPSNFVPSHVPSFLRLLPLSEIIAAVLGGDSPSTQAVWKIYNTLIAKFGDEYSVLIDATEDALNDAVESRVADAILRVRAGSVSVVPGYDGVYGKLDLAGKTSADKVHHRGVQQSNLADFF